MAAASLPAPTLIGAERVVIECNVDERLPEALRREICEQLVGKAQRLTTLPVSHASPSDADLRNLRDQWKQLRLRVTANEVDAGNGRRTLELSVTAERPGRPIAAAGPIRSRSSLIRVQKDWVLMGPVEGFQKLLAGSGPPRLRTPIVSE